MAQTREQRERAKEERMREIARKKLEESESKKLESLQAVWGKINQDLKASVIVDSDQIIDTTYIRRPSGIMEMDLQLAGGLPPGMSVISGPDSVGKSRLTYAMIRMNQRIYGERSRVMYCCAEFTPTLLYMRKAGVMVRVPDAIIEKINSTRIKLGGEPVSDEEIAYMKTQVGIVKFLLFSDAQTVLEAVINTAKTNACQLIVIDTISTLLTDDEDTKKVEERNARATHANAVTQFVKKMHPVQLGVYGPNHTTIVILSQVRAAENKPGTPAHLMKKWEAKGAHALKHGKIFDIELSNGYMKPEKSKENDEEEKAKAVKVGKMLRWKLSKAKSGAHEGVDGEAPYYYENEYTGEGDGFCESKSVYRTGVKLGVIRETKKNTGPITLMNGYTKEPTDTVLDTPEEFIERIEEDIDFELFVREQILACGGIECSYRLD